MSDIEIIAEKEVTVESIQALFRRAFHETSIEDGTILIETDGPTVWVSIEEDDKLLSYFVFYPFVDDASPASKYELVSNLNGNLTICRFSMIDDGKALVIDYMLPYTEGVIAFHVVSSARRLARDAASKIRLYDEEGLIRL